MNSREFDDARRELDNFIDEIDLEFIKERFKKVHTIDLDRMIQIGESLLDFPEYAESLEILKILRELLRRKRL